MRQLLVTIPVTKGAKWAVVDGEALVDCAWYLSSQTLDDLADNLSRAIKEHEPDEVVVDSVNPVMTTRDLERFGIRARVRRK